MANGSEQREQTVGLRKTFVAWKHCFLPAPCSPQPEAVDWLLHWGQSPLGFSKIKRRTEEAILGMGKTLVRVEILTLHLVNKEALVGASELAHEVQKSEP